MPHPTYREDNRRTNNGFRRVSQEVVDKIHDMTLEGFSARKILAEISKTDTISYGSIYKYAKDARIILDKEKGKYNVMPLVEVDFGKLGVEEPVKEEIQVSTLTITINQLKEIYAGVELQIEEILNEVHRNLKLLEALEQPQTLIEQLSVYQSVLGMTSPIITSLAQEQQQQISDLATNPLSEQMLRAKIVAYQAANAGEKSLTGK